MESEPSIPGYLWEETSVEGFTAQQASKLTSCTAHQLRYWDRVNLVTPSIQTTGGRPGRRRLYNFRDLVALRVVKSLLDNGMSVQRVRRAWDYLRRTAEMDKHLSEVRLVTDGQTIFRVAQDEEQLLDALRQGQLAFFVAINEIAQSVEEDVTRFELDRDRFLDMLRRVEDDVSTELGEASG
jgi:DNA-binding transcriptional MerR regulator